MQTFLSFTSSKIFESLSMTAHASIPLLLLVASLIVLLYADYH